MLEYALISEENDLTLIQLDLGSSSLLVLYQQISQGPVRCTALDTSTNSLPFPPQMLCLLWGQAESRDPWSHTSHGRLLLSNHADYTIRLCVQTRSRPWGQAKGAHPRSGRLYTCAQTVSRPQRQAKGRNPQVDCFIFWFVSVCEPLGAQAIHTKTSLTMSELTRSI